MVTNVKVTRAHGWYLCRIGVARLTKLHERAALLPEQEWLIFEMHCRVGMH